MEAGAGYVLYHNNMRVGGVSGFSDIPSRRENAVVFLIIGIVTAYVLGFSLLYAYPLLARYENTVMNTLKNSFRISMKYFLRSLLLVLLMAFEIAVMIWNYATMILIVLAGPAFLMLTVSGFAMIIFRELEKTPGTVSVPENPEDAEYSENTEN